MFRQREMEQSAGDKEKMASRSRIHNYRSAHHCGPPHTDRTVHPCPYHTYSSSLPLSHLQFIPAHITLTVHPCANYTYSSSLPISHLQVIHVQITLTVHPCAYHTFRYIPVQITLTVNPCPYHTYSSSLCK